MTSINPNLPPSFYTPSGELRVSSEVAQQVSTEVETRIKDMPPAEKEAFLALLRLSSSIDGLIPTSGLIDAGKLDVALDRLEGAANALLQLSQIGVDLIDMLARVMIEQAGEQRKNALEDRLQAREAARTGLLDQAGKMVEAANEMRSGAIAQLVIGLVMSVVQIGLSCLSLKYAGSAMKENTKMVAIDDANPSMAAQANNAKVGGDVQGLNAKGGGWGGLGGAAGGLGNSMGNVANTWAQANSKNTEAEGSVLAAQAEYDKGQADIKKEIQDAVNQMIQSLISFLKELKEAEVNMMQAITRG